MKKMLSILVVMAILIAVNSFAAADKTFTISGYAPGVYTLTGDAMGIFSQAIKNVPAGAKTFHIVGYADRSGDSIKNQDIGKNRAEEVGAEIKRHFPNAEVIIQTRGDSGNAREVVVNYSLVVPVKEKNYFSLILVGIAGLLLLALAFLFKVAKSEKAKPATVENAKTEKLESDWLVVKSKGQSYKVFIEKKPNEEGVMMWHSRFQTSSGQPIRAIEKKQLIKNLIGPLWKPEFGFQKEALIKEEMIVNA